MPSMSEIQMLFMDNLRKSDNKKVGSLGCSVKTITNPRLRRRAEDQCIGMGWVRTTPRRDLWLRTLYLTTKGLHALQAAERRRDRLER